MSEKASNENKKMHYEEIVPKSMNGMAMLQR